MQLIYYRRTVGAGHARPLSLIHIYFYLDEIMGTYYISLNDQKEPFTDPNVRKAMSLAIDRDYVANTIMQGIYTPATCLLYTSRCV